VSSYLILPVSMLVTVATYAALIRGINVGGRAKLPMAALKAGLTELGYEDVVTYIQSGNAVFRTAGRPATSAGSARTPG
jgi:uncharacterized protein (DUF1697 family)